MTEEQVIPTGDPPPPGGAGTSGSAEKPARREPRESPKRGGRRGAGGRRFFRRRKVCKFCTEKRDHIDYKDVNLIRPFTGDRGKILPRRLTGVCTPHQRQLKVAIKRARNIALLPFAVEF